MIKSAINPVVLAGNGVIRVNATQALRDFAKATNIGVASSFMAKGVIDYEDELSLGSVGLQAGDYTMAGFDDADLVIAVGYDLVEHAPKLSITTTLRWNTLLCSSRLMHSRRHLPS